MIKKIIITHHEDLWQFSEQEQLLKFVRKYFWSVMKVFLNEFPYQLGERKNNFILIFRKIHYIFLSHDVLVKYEK